MDNNFVEFDIIDTYKSMIWTDRYYECGDFELYTAMTPTILNTIKQGYYLSRLDSEHVMIIEKILINSTVEDGDMLTVTGRSIESILDRRVIWGQKTLNGNLQEGIKTLLMENVISPSNANRKIPNFIFEASTDPAITGLTIDAQYTGDNLYDVIQAICAEREIGFKVTLNDSKQFVFKLYAGVDRSYEQTENTYVIFSSRFDNLISSNYMESKSSLKNVTLVGGEGEGSARRYTAVGNVSGLDRRELFTDARDISSDIDEDISASFNFSQYASQVFNNSSKTFVTDANFNSCMVDVSAYAGRTIRISIPKYSVTSGVATNYATVLVNSSKQYISTLKVWESYDSANQGSLEDYEIVLPTDAAYIYTSMYSQAAIDKSIYYGKTDDFDCTTIKLSNTEYISMLRQRGKEKLAENIEITSFEGEAETTTMFKYGEDFFNGDVVQISDEYGHETQARILEIVTSDDEQGFSVYPTFSMIQEKGE